MVMRPLCKVHIHNEILKLSLPTALQLMNQVSPSANQKIN
jgi:hypothetical protein